MPSTLLITEDQLDALAGKLAALDETLDPDDRVALLTVFALAGEALAARVDAAAEVSGFAMGAFNVGIQVQVPDILPDAGDGLRGSVSARGRKAGEGQKDFLKVTLKEVFISS